MIYIETYQLFFIILFIMTPQYLFRSHQDRQVFYAWFSGMHTRIDVVFTDIRLDEGLCVSTVEEMAGRIAGLEHAGNCFDPASELSVFNANTPGVRATLSPDLAQMLSHCQLYHKLTDGLFDVTMPHGGTFHVEGNRAWRDGEQTKINLSGFLKGYALDQLRPIVESMGLGNALISLGNSSVMAMGRGLDGKPWRVAIPAGGEQVELRDECLTTSGNDSPERRHIVNPMTGEYAEGQRQVSVVTKEGATGEVLSTCFFIADKKKRLRLASLFHVDRYFV